LRWGRAVVVVAAYLKGSIHMDRPEEIPDNIKGITKVHLGAINTTIYYKLILQYLI
jgi:hypothetical protein